MVGIMRHISDLDSHSGPMRADSLTADGFDIVFLSISSRLAKGNIISALVTYRYFFKVSSDFSIRALYSSLCKEMCKNSSLVCASRGSHATRVYRSTWGFVYFMHAPSYATRAGLFSVTRFNF